jgi:hypothetical protein
MAGNRMGWECNMRSENDNGIKYLVRKPGIQEPPLGPSRRWGQ